MRVLLIVDIQRSMGCWFAWNYIAKVDKFLRQHASEYDRIVMIMEPTWKVNKEKNTKDYTIMKPDAVPSFILPYLSDGKPHYKTYNREYWRYRTEVMELTPPPVMSLPPEEVEKDPFPIFMSPDFRDLMYSLRIAEKVDVIGGGRTKCVALTSRILKKLGVNHEIVHEACYDIFYVNTNRRDVNTFKTKPTTSIRKSLLAPTGSLKLSEIPLLF